MGKQTMALISLLHKHLSACITERIILVHQQNANSAYINVLIPPVYINVLLYPFAVVLETRVGAEA